MEALSGKRCRTWLSVAREEEEAKGLSQLSSWWRPRDGPSQHLLFSTHNQYTNPIFSLSCRVSVNPGSQHAVPKRLTALTNISVTKANNTNLRLGYAPKLEKCKAEKGERITVSAVSSPTKISWYSMSEERTVKACMDGFLLTSLCLSWYFLLSGRNLVALPIFSLTVLPVLTLIVTYFLSACLRLAFVVLVTASLSVTLPTICLLLPSPFLTSPGHHSLPLATVRSLRCRALESFICLWGFSPFYADGSACWFSPSWLVSIQRVACVRDPHPSSLAHPKSRPCQHFCSQIPLY